LSYRGNINYGHNEIDYRLYNETNQKPVSKVKSIKRPMQIVSFSQEISLKRPEPAANICSTQILNSKVLQPSPHVQFMKNSIIG
jgi:hypothetical protein